MSDRQEKGTLRSLSSFEEKIDFFSNDYLGWGHRKTNFSDQAGSTGSRLLSGNSSEYTEIEADLASYFGAEDALHFNSGYDANLGVFSTIPQKGDTILYDALIHASARDGIRLSWSNSLSFRHNDLEHLKSHLEKAEGAVYVAVEALYSMDGDIAPLQELTDLCKTYGAYLIVDEAHSGGFFGPDGKGMVADLGLESEVFLRLITFGKAYGSHGALVLGSTDLKKFLVNFCRPFIYSTALPVYVLRHNHAVAKSPESPDIRAKLKEIIHYYRERMTEIPQVSDALSPIQVVGVGAVEKTQEIADKLQQQGMAVKPIFSPTVPVGKERIRICLHAFNTKEQVDKLTALLRKELV